MNAQPSNQIIPVWTLPDRMNKAMNTASLSVSDMVELLGVHRNTVGGYIHGRIQPDEEMLKKWALHTGVLFEWLKYGDQPTPTQLHRAPGISKRKRNQHPSEAAGVTTLPDPAEYLQQRLRRTLVGPMSKPVGYRLSGGQPRAYRCPSR
jgi:transcriptional regulator with XRE-family HTH domain